MEFTSFLDLIVQLLKSGVGLLVWVHMFLLPWGTAIATLICPFPMHASSVRKLIGYICKVIYIFLSAAMWLFALKIEYYDLLSLTSIFFHSDIVYVICSFTMYGMFWFACVQMKKYG